MQSPGWYFRRLSLMSPTEVAWRIQQVALDLRDRQWPARSSGVHDLGDLRLAEWPAPSSASHAAFESSAERVLNGEVDLFGAWMTGDRSSAGWNRDPVSGVVSPMVHGKFLDYRRSDIVGSARNVWEVNRHFQFVTLAQAWTVSRDARYMDAALDMIKGWVRDCPYPLGINWASALESGIRLINWYIGSRLFGTWRSGIEPVPGWLDSIYLHCRFIRRNRSRHSSANNHLIGEMAGLYVASTAWPCWRESARWQRFAKRALESEARKQVHADGVIKEQTVGYQMFVLQFLLIAGLTGESNGDGYSTGYWQTVRRMIGYLGSIADSGGHLPDFGDSDDGMAYKLGPRAQERRLEDLIALDASLSGATPGKLAGDSTAAWLATGFARPSNYPSGTLVHRQAFPSGGYFVLRHESAGREEVHAVVDAGPLGYLSIAAHGHADCLSLTLSLDGSQVLVDPGTYCYHDDVTWRDYFRSTAAHNTVRIDGIDQSEMAGPFMWLSKAEAHVESLGLSGDEQHVRACHDGYTRLADPVKHEREVRLDAAGASLAVIDRLDCAAPHRVERFWHFAEAFAVTVDGPGRVVAESDRCTVEIRAEADHEISIHRGSLEPRAGWISRRFGALAPTTTVVFSGHVDGSKTMNTAISWGRK